MFQAPPEPMLPGWTPLQQPAPRPSGGEVRRWLWPGTVLAAFATVTAYVLATSPGPGISNRGLVTLGLAALVLTVLTLRRRWGLRAMASTLAEYAAVATLAALLVLAAPPPSADQPTRADRPAQAERASTLPPVIREVVGAWDWLAELWRRADPDAGRTPPPSTTRPNGEAMVASPHSPTPPAPSIWRSHA